MKNSSNHIGRFAPSPSGRMHLGNIFSALIAWLYTKQNGGKIILRIDDLDKIRCKDEHIYTLQKDLEFLGLHWDEGTNDNFYRQSKCTDYYEQILQQISEKAEVYNCYCTRADINSHSAPHEQDGEIVYSGHCKNILLNAIEKQKKHTKRLCVKDEYIYFNDENYGEFSHNILHQCGDFVLKRNDGVFAYQLACVADDIKSNVSEVVRGRDLLSSCARQIYLYKLLGKTPPHYFHVPLLFNESGTRLSKREKSLDLGELSKKYTSGQIIGLLGYYANLIPKGQSLSPSELLPYFNAKNIGTKDIIVPNELVI